MTDKLSCACPMCQDNRSSISPTDTAQRDKHVIPDEVIEAAAEALVSSTLGDRSGIKWEEFFEAARGALNAAAPYLMAKAFDEGQKSGMRHVARLAAAAEIGKPELPGPISPNPYKLKGDHA